MSVQRRTWVVAAVGLAVTLGLGACADPPALEAAAEPSAAATPAGVVVTDTTCEEEVATELELLFVERNLVVTNEGLWQGHLGDLIVKACRRFPDRSAEKTAEWVLACLGVGNGMSLEGIEEVDR